MGSISGKRLELANVMKDRTLSRQEKQEKMAEIRAKYAEEEERGPPVHIDGPPGPPASIDGPPASIETKSPAPSPRRPKRVPKTVAANVMNSGSTDDMVFNAGKQPEQPEPQATHAPPAPTPSRSPTRSPNRSTSDDPLADMATDRTPIKRLIKMIKSDDPSLTVLKLDGRKKIKSDDWESLFESLEDNATITHLSISRCDIEDSMAVSLVLALVENETLVELQLNSNKGLTDDTGKGFVKVLRQSNSTLKKLGLLKTKVTKKSTNELNAILQERDDPKEKDKVQVEREEKLKALLSFSASDAIAKEAAATTLDVSNRSESNLLDEPDTTKKKGKKKKDNWKTMSDSTALVTAGRGRGGRGSRASMRAGRGSNRQSTLRASMTAQQMAQLGGDLANVGADANKIKEQRKARGECETCGQKCYNKTMFKSTPLTVPRLVYEGRCLKCNPM